MEKNEGAEESEVIPGQYFIHCTLLSHSKLLLLCFHAWLIDAGKET
jgi:hypothetical protein